MWLEQFYALGNEQDKVCTRVSLLSEEGDRQETPGAGKFMLQVKVKRWDVRMPRGCLRRAGRKAVCEETLKLGSERGKEPAMEGSCSLTQ